MYAITSCSNTTDSDAYMSRQGSQGEVGSGEVGQGITMWIPENKLVCGKTASIVHHSPPRCTSTGTRHKLRRTSCVSSPRGGACFTLNAGCVHRTKQLNAAFKTVTMPMISTASYGLVLDSPLALSSMPKLMALKLQHKHNTHQHPSMESRHNASTVGSPCSELSRHSARHVPPILPLPPRHRATLLPLQWTQILASSRSQCAQRWRREGVSGSRNPATTVVRRTYNSKNAVRPT